MVCRAVLATLIASREMWNMRFEDSIVQGDFCNVPAVMAAEYHVMMTQTMAMAVMADSPRSSRRNMWFYSKDYFTPCSHEPW